jgi:hypothetical protein
MRFTSCENGPRLSTGDAAWSADPTPSVPLFESVLLAGFECSDHKLEDGRRLDLLRSTGHDRLARQDYARMRELGMTACREGVSWVRSERRAGQYDFDSARRRLRAASEQGVEVLWDLLHFGWPDDVDVFAPSFPRRFGSFASAFAQWFKSESDARLIVAPINEMSFLAWAGGDVRCMNPFEQARGVELKVQLVLATIEAIDAIRAVLPSARFLSPEPIIHIAKDPAHPKTWARVESDDLLQFQAWDMLSGRVWPRLGGHPRYLDILGVNYYPDNQFMLDGATLRRGDPDYQEFSTLLLRVWQRYRVPLIVSETGSEGELRAPWFRYMVDECCLALRAGCQLHGLTLYPITNHPGWVDDRHCENGLWGYPDEAGARAIYAPLAEEVKAATCRLRAERAAMLARASTASSGATCGSDAVLHAQTT